MADTVATLTTDLKRIFQDATTAACERAINMAHREIVTLMPDIARTTTSVNLTSGTSSYDLNVEIGEVLSVVYQTAANTAIPLMQTTRRQLENEQPGTTAWAQMTSGTPDRFFLEGSASTDSAQLKIVLYPTPNTTTSAGYPVLSVTHSVMATLDSAGSDTIPEGGPALAMFYKFRAAQHLAEELQPGRTPNFAAQADYWLKLSFKQWGEKLPEAGIAWQK
jgi:hypothetical protein